MRTIIRWTEEELLREIDGLDSILESDCDIDDAVAKAAHSYRKQLLRDRKDTLRLLQYRRNNRLNAVNGSDRPRIF